MIDSHKLWLIIGFSGQALFSARFIVQWITSEVNQKSIIPTAFWYLSLVGGLTLLAYAIHIRDPVIITGQAFGSIVYIRNLMFIRRERIKAHATCPQS